MLYMFLLRKTFLMWVFYWKNSASFRFDFPFFPQISIDIDWGQGERKKCFFTLLKNLFNFVCKKQSRMLTKISVFLNMKFTFLSHFLLRKTQKKIGFLIEKIQHFLYKNVLFLWCIFGNFAQWKMRFFLRKNGEKIRFFIAFPAIFRDFCKIEKNSQVQNFWRILKGAPCKYTGRSWADHGQIMGRSWADHGQIMSRSWALVDFQRGSERLSRKKADNRADNR